MKTINKLTPGQATFLTKKIITCINNHNKELRTMLVNAQLSNIHEAFNDDSFDDYLEKRIVPKIGMKKDYAKNIANSGLVEMQILGKEKIGTMKEYPLRKLYENVNECHRVKVYQLARKGLEINKYPTGTQIIEAAKKLKVYKQQASKLNPIEKNTDTKANKNNKETKKKQADIKSPTAPSKSNIISIKSLSSNKVSKIIIDAYQPADIRKILGYLRVLQDKEILNQCSYIGENCEEKVIRNLITKLSLHLKNSIGTAKVKTSTRPSNIAKSNR